MVFKICANGFLQSVTPAEFTEAELYIKTIDKFEYEVSQIPEHIKIVSVHSPIYVEKNRELKLLDLTDKQVQRESIDAIKQTIKLAKQYKIPKLVLHCSTYNPKTENKREVIAELAEILKPLYSDNLQISFETDVRWFNTYLPQRSLLTSVEEFQQLDDCLEGKLFITLDVEHVFLTSAFNQFIREYDVQKLSRNEFEELYKKFVIGKHELITSVFKRDMENFFDSFADKIVHIHINGSDYRNFVFDPETFLPLLGEHLPLGYKDEVVQDQLDYNFIAEQFSKLLEDGQIFIVLELGVRDKKYNFQEALHQSKLFLAEFLQELK